MKNKRLVILSGPSGVGKGTVIQKLLEKTSQIELAVSATTRQPRNDEVEGKTYYFLSHDQFDKHVSNNAFLEWCQVHQNRYGTLKNEVKRVNQLNKICLLEIDTQGAMKIKEEISDVLLIFIAPPSEDILKKRLESRNSESHEIIKKRLYGAKAELKQIKHYDFVVINDKIETSVANIAHILKQRFNFEEL